MISFWNKYRTKTPTSGYFWSEIKNHDGDTVMMR